eukprot:TRINITY_DN7723_c0_g1_i4.p1 TRINITY_DN7723_c0_g1~~TRINITY_DN7723_c0_g1_i4.p1  ORF type:complete len:242 (-),score=-9.92 TRINITY_DN7723_c0_g1_i4:18-743(-)
MYLLADHLCRPRGLKLIPLYCMYLVEMILSIKETCSIFCYMVYYQMQIMSQSCKMDGQRYLRQQQTSQEGCQNHLQQLRSNYTYIIFVNSSIRGPFYTAYEEQDWVTIMKEQLNMQEDVKVFGASINCELYAWNKIKPWMQRQLLDIIKEIQVYSIKYMQLQDHQYMHKLFFVAIFQPYYLYLFLNGYDLEYKYFEIYWKTSTRNYSPQIQRPFQKWNDLHDLLLIQKYFSLKQDNPLLKL